MDFLLIVVAIGGFVVSMVMLVLASRANRLQQESDERVETLEAMATGSVLFGHAWAAEPEFEPAMRSEPATQPEPATLPLFARPAPSEPAVLSGRVTVLEPAPLPPSSQPSPADDLDLALDAFADEDDVAPPKRVTPAPPYPFVLTVSAAAGAGRVQVSFDRARNRSRP